MSINRVTLLGHLGKDPESRVLDNGKKVASFTIATTERAFKTASGVEIPERTDWHNIIAWGGPAEIADKYLFKGAKVYVEGKLKSRSYTDNAGAKKYVTEVFVETIELLDARKQGATQETQQDHTANIPQQEYNSNPDDLPF